MTRKLTIWPLVLILCFAELALSWGVSEDLFWYTGYLSRIQALSISLVLFVILVMALILSGVYVSQRRRDLSVEIGRIRRHRLVVAFAVIFTVAMIGLSTIPVANLNDVYNVPINNSDSHREWDGPTRVVIVDGVTNATSSNEVRLSFWYNTSVLENATAAYFVFYNGSHRSDDYEYRIYPQGYPDFYWWTDFSWFGPEMFGNGSEIIFLTARIPAQRANTTVEYLFALRMENGSETSYMHHEGNYTVLFSEAENEIHTQFIQITHYYSGLLCGLIFINLYLLDNWQNPEQEDISEIEAKAKKAGILGEESAKLSYPSVVDLIQRTDTMELVRNDLRNSSGVFLTLSIAFLIFIQSNRDLTPLLVMTQLGVLSAILASLGCLVISLSATSVTQSDLTIDDSLIPSTESEYKFRLLVLMKIRRIEFLTKRTRTMMQVGVLTIAVGLITDTVLRFLRPWDTLFTNLVTMFMGPITILLILGAGVLYVRIMLRDAGISYL